MVLLAGTPAAAQAVPGDPAFELAMGGVIVAPRSLGSTSADLTQPDGAAYPLFQVEHRQQPGYGAELILGIRLVPRLWAEASGSWVRSELQTRVFGDQEGAADVTITGALSRVETDGGLAWHVIHGTAGAFYVRGSVGWVRELAGRSGLLDDGISATLGAGVKYWGRRAPAVPGRIGLRAEIRVVMRSAALEPGAADPIVAPAGYAGVLVRF